MAERGATARLCPELNPVEQAWAWVKNGPLAHYCAPTLADLTDTASGSLDQRYANILNCPRPSYEIPDLTGHEQRSNRSTIGIKLRGLLIAALQEFHANTRQL